MNETDAKAYTDFILPPSIVSRGDISRLVREAERVDNELTSASVRTKTGASNQEETVMAGFLKEFLDQNALAFSDSLERSRLIKQLRRLKDTVPVIHMTFAVTADQTSLRQLAEWLRTSVHPQAVIEVGLQPSLVAGVYLRTPNHVHDMSLRHAFDGRRGVLVKELEAFRGNR